MFASSDWSTFTPDPADADWHIFEARDTVSFHRVIGPVRVRLDGARAIVRLQPRPDLLNLDGFVHGAALLGFIDIAIFPAAMVLGVDPPSGVTLDVNAHFVSGADGERPLDAVIEVTNETRRMAFVRGTIEQGGDVVLSFMAIIRKQVR